MQFVAEPKVEGEARRNFPIILAVPCVGVTATIHGGFGHGGIDGVVRVPEEKCGIRIANACRSAESQFIVYIPQILARHGHANLRRANIAGMLQNQRQIQKCRSYGCP